VTGLCVQVQILVEQKKGRKSVAVLNIITDEVEVDLISRQLDSSARLHCTRFCLQHPQFAGNTSLSQVARNMYVSK